MAGLLFLLLEHLLEEGFGFRDLFLHLQLAKDRMPADVKLVPLTFHVAERGVVEFAEETERGSAANEGEDFVFAGRAGLDGGEDHFHLLDDDAFDLEELAFLFLAEFLGAGEVDEMVKLFPALGVVFQLLDELVHLFGLHRRWWLYGLAGFAGESLRYQKDNRSTAQFARDELQTGILNDDFGERGLGGLRGTECHQHLRGDVVHKPDRECLGECGGQNAALAIDGETAAGQGNERRGGLGKKIQETHKASSFFIDSRI